MSQFGGQTRHGQCAHSHGAERLAVEPADDRDMDDVDVQSVGDDFMHHPVEFADVDFHMLGNLIHLLFGEIGGALPKNLLQPAH